MASNTYFILIPAVSFVLYCILLIIMLRSRQNKIIRMYSLYLIAMIVWSFGSFIMRTNLYPGPLFWNRVLCIGLIGVPVIFYHFTLLFTETYGNTKRLYFGYFSAAALLLLNLMGFIVTDAFMADNMFYYRLGFGTVFVALYSMGYLMMAIINIIGQVKSKKIPFNRVKLIYYGLILVFSGCLLNLSPDIGKYPIDIASNTVNAVLIWYSIYRYKFLSAGSIIRKGINYSLYTLILAASYVVVAFIVDKLLAGSGNKTVISSLIMAVIMVITTQPLHKGLQTWIDMWFFRERFFHREALRDFTNVINNILDLNELTYSLLQVLVKGIQPKSASLMLRLGDEEGYHLFQTTSNADDVKSILFHKNHPIIRWFSTNNAILTFDEIEKNPFFTGLWGIEKDLLIKLEAELFIPIKLRDTLTGLLILSEKTASIPYTQDDLDLLFAVLNSSAVAIENARQYSIVKEDAITDGLTKLYNHRYIHETLAKIINNKTMDAFSVVMLDIDFFKLYNDLYGHHVGDRTLAKMGEILKRSVRKDDIVARYGGEEFVIILSNVEGRNALAITERIRCAVEDYFNTSNDTHKFVTISAGVSVFPDHGRTREELLKCADTALYTAKRNGRNQCVLYTRGDEVSSTIGGDTNVRDKIESAYFSAIYALAATIDAKDHYTYGHSENVSRYASALAAAAGFDEETVDIVKNAGLLHDIGKIGIPENILTKPSRLTDEEMQIMTTHVDISITIIKHVPSLLKVVPAILCHHERYDGKGYPRGIQGTNIPVEARFLCIADSFDAMVSHRPYRKALPVEVAIGELRKNSGTQFDPELVSIFIDMVENKQLAV